MSEPTEAMVEAGRKSWVDAITDPEHDGNGGPVFAEMYRRMKALDPDFRAAPTDAVEAVARALCGYDLEWRDCETRCMAAGKCAGTLNEHQLDQARAALAAMSVQSDKGEG